MKQETQNILNELEYLGYGAFCWDFDKHGEFSILKLMDNYGLIKEIDLKSVFLNWQKIENQGAVAPEFLYDIQGIKDILSSEEQKQRDETYALLLQYLESNLTEIQALSISSNDPIDSWDSFEFIDFDFSKAPISLIIGKTNEGYWLALCQTAPNELRYYEQFVPQVPTALNKSSNNLQTNAYYFITSWQK